MTRESESDTRESGTLTQQYIHDKLSCACSVIHDFQKILRKIKIKMHVSLKFELTYTIDSLKQKPNECVGLCYC